MAYSRLAAIARRSYFDPDEEEEKQGVAAKTEAELAELFEAENNGAPGGGRGASKPMAGGGSDTVFQQVKMGPSAPVATNDAGLTPGGRPKTSTAGKRPGTRGGGDGTSEATDEAAKPPEAGSSSNNTPADARPSSRASTRGGRRNPGATTTANNEAADNPPATDTNKAAVSPSATSSKFTIDDFQERPASRAGAGGLAVGSATRRTSQYREGGAGSEEGRGKSDGALLRTTMGEGGAAGEEGGGGRPKTAGRRRVQQDQAPPVATAEPTQPPQQPQQPPVQSQPAKQPPQPQLQPPQPQKPSAQPQQAKQPPQTQQQPPAKSQVQAKAPTSAAEEQRRTSTSSLPTTTAKPQQGGGDWRPSVEAGPIPPQPEPRPARPVVDKTQQVVVVGDDTLRMAMTSDTLRGTRKEEGGKDIGGTITISARVPTPTRRKSSSATSASAAAAGKAKEEESYALVPVAVVDEAAHEEPNFVLVGDMHSRFDEEGKEEAEGTSSRAVDDYDLIGREPMITVTSQKSLFELLQREAARHEQPPAGEQQEEEEAMQHEQQPTQEAADKPPADAATWGDGLHYGSGDGSAGYQQQYYQQQQGEEASYVCGECERHQEDIPPSHYAAAVGHLACLQAISQRDPYAPMGFDSASRSTLFYASANDRADCCEFLIDWYTPLINLPDMNGDTPIHAAASSGSETCLYLLIHKGHASMDVQNKMGMTPAHLAKNASILRQLFEAGAFMSSQDRHGRSPLYLACAMNRTECAAYLSEIADLDQLTLPDRRGDTPLHAAAFHGNRECLLLLLQFGAPPTTPNSKGLTPIDLARKKGHAQCLKILQEYHLHHSTNFDSVLFLATVEGHQAVKQQQPSTTLSSKKSICLKNYKEWLAYEYADGRTFWYNSSTGASQWQQPAELVMSPTSLSKLQSTDPTNATKLKQVGEWIKYSNPKTQSFYYNPESGAFQWTQPPEFLMQSSYRVTARQQGQQDDSQQQQAQEVRGWQVYRDPVTSKTFYYNPVTQVSSWEPPPEGEGVAGQWATEAGGEEDAKEVTELSDLGV